MFVRPSLFSKAKIIRVVDGYIRDWRTVAQWRQNEKKQRSRTFLRAGMTMSSTGVIKLPAGLPCHAAITRLSSSLAAD